MFWFHKQLGAACVSESDLVCVFVTEMLFEEHTDLSDIPLG